MKAIALYSGGLDSLLAMKLIINQGIEVVGLNVNIGFGSTKNRYSILEERAKSIGATFLEIDIRSQFLRDILFSPKYGYGKNFNPCIDCHANMFRVAKNMMSELGASFLISGEVVGQRPMSQNPKALQSVLKLSESEEILLRPLSAKLLPITLPEKMGWVDRDNLLDISGRSREKQFQLAKEFGLQNYESPAGGCLLTEPYFTKKIRDFIKYDKLEVDDINSLKFGRHFRLEDGAKLIIGRNQEDNLELQKVQSSKFLSLEAVGVKSPIALISFNSSDKDFQFALKAILTYTKAEKGKEYKILLNGQKEFWATPFENRQIVQKWSI